MFWHTCPTNHWILNYGGLYFLLNVGKYTRPPTVLQNSKWVLATQTKQYTVGNVGFFRNGKVVFCNSSLHTLINSDLAVLKIANQKNGPMGQTITQHVTNEPVCPTKALAHLVHHIKSNGGDDDTLLCSFYDSQTWGTVESKDIINTVRHSATSLKLEG